VSAADVEELLTGPGGLHVDRLDMVTPEGQANRDNMQVGGAACGCMSMDGGVLYLEHVWTVYAAVYGSIRNIHTWTVCVDPIARLPKLGVTDWWRSNYMATLVRSIC
jgi:hypothetical protein